MVFPAGLNSSFWRLSREIPGLLVVTSTRFFFFFLLLSTMFKELSLCFPVKIQKPLYILLAYSFNINNNTITHKCSSSLLDLSDLRISHLFTERSSQYFSKYSNFPNQIYNKFAS